MTTPNQDTPKEGWHLDPTDPKRVSRFSAGEWSKSMTVDEALLNYLHDIESKTKYFNKIERNIDSIRFRVGFLALVTLVGVILTILIFASSLATFLSALSGTS